MNKIYLLLIFVSVFAINAKSQVTIGSQDAPTPGAALELKSTNLGFLPTRVALTDLEQLTPLTGVKADCEGMVVYNTTDNATSGLFPGLYYFDGTRWVRLTFEPFPPLEKWFYMPSIVFNTETSGTGFVKDLYNAYKTQLNTAGDLVVPSSGAGTPTKVLASIPAATDLYYYVTGYDENVFDNISINASGVMTYDIIDQASDSTYLNIVFVQK